ncbi:Unknown protein [Striga hermonthica]|uniref:Uncharacterized protein n=1 Tax=Striga hermonthica TaxID=68872 RepID=A0A9N7MZG6_STRHE|nr:Unknown protein [Striga hermonthica]
MLVKPDPTGANPSLTLPPATACGNCGAEERRLLHHVRHRGIFRRLCTSCVLRLHPQSFCPTCFQVYPPTPSLDAIATCFKCYSSSHSHCVRPGGPTPYVCPLCLHPNTRIFKLKSAKEANAGEATEDCRVMDRDAAKKLLAAAKIASMSMNKAAIAAKVEAERRAKEAAYTRKRAKEALEYVAHLVMKEKQRKEGAGPVGPSCMRMGREINNVNVSSGYRIWNAGGDLGQTVTVDGRIVVSSGNADMADNSGLPVAAGLKGNEKMRGGISGQGVGPGLRVVANRVAMDVDDKGNNRECVNFMNSEGGSENVDAQGEQMEDEEEDDDDDVLVQFVEDQMQHEEENNNGREHHTNGMEVSE